MGNQILKNKEFEKFCRNHNERQIYPMQKILEKYPSLRLYGFKTAMKEWTHHHFSHYDIYECECDKCDYLESFSCVFNKKTCHSHKHHFSKTHFYPHFLPDLYMVTDEVILLFEVEDYSPMTKKKMNSIYNWYLHCDMSFEPEIIVYGFDRFGNFQRVINSFINTKKEALEWLSELENTTDYKNQDLNKFKLYEDREPLKVNGFKNSIGYCKLTRDVYSSEEEYLALQKTTEGSRYY